VNSDSVEATVALFRELTPTIVRVESLEAAEMAKLINNAFRDLIFAFSNHVAHVATHFNIDVTEVIRAANRGYPRDPVPLPSPGVGGPCLTKDPYILDSVARRAGIGPTLFALGRAVNESIHERVADDVVAQLRKVGKDPMKCTVLLCGLAFKGDPETADLRNSSALEIAGHLRGKVGALRGHDPVADAAQIQAAGITPVDLPDGFHGADAVLFLNNHRSYKKIDVYSMMRSVAAPGVLYDGWQHFRAENVLEVCPCVYMGHGFARTSVGERS